MEQLPQEKETVLDTAIDGIDVDDDDDDHHEPFGAGGKGESRSR